MLGDAGYQDIGKRRENRGTKVRWHIAIKRSKRKMLPVKQLGGCLSRSSAPRRENGRR